MTPRLEITRFLAAPPERVFSAWTEPEQLVRWWGPQGVTCVGAHVEAHAGGRYRLENQLTNGDVITIHGEFLTWDPPHLLVYSWAVGTTEHSPPEQVTVHFEAQPGGTQLTVVHERIPDETTRRSHDLGWQGCLKGLQLELMAVQEGEKL